MLRYNIYSDLQGILVCIVHVFFNKDVHSAIKNKWRKFKGQTNMVCEFIL